MMNRYQLTGFSVLVALLVFSCKPEKEASSVVQEEQPRSITISDITVDSLQQWLHQKASAPLLLDVRTPEEVASGVIGDQTLHININGDTFEQQVSQLDKQATYVVYCQAGKRSSRAQQYMKDQGFESVINLTGGMSAWNSAGFAIDSIN